MHPSLAAERRSLRHMTAVSRHAALFAALTWFAVAASGMGPVPALAAVGAVTISSPPNAGQIQSAAPAAYIGLVESGYVEEEFFLSGVATRYGRSGVWTSDGIWTVTPAGQEPYTTRVVVRRPTDPKKFNGTVVVEWVNVTRGFDADATFPHTWPLLLREGYAWVGVSAQKVGIDALKVIDPIRYAAVLSGSTDGFSYDIFSQVGNAFRAQADVLLSGLAPQRILAVGTSQSAGRLVTYVNAIHLEANVFDGFLIHARSGAGAAIDNIPGGPPGTTVSVPSPSRIRADVNVPVFTVNSETDATGYFPARQPDSAMFLYWEVAGSSHAPWFRNQYSNVQAGLPVDTNLCTGPHNDMPFHYVLQAALSHLNNWVATGTPAPSLPKMDIQGTPAVIQRDQYGNAIGGVRLPQINVPIARYAPTGSTSSPDPLVGLICRLAGTTDYWSNTAEAPTPPTDPWPEPSLKALYRNHGKYVSAFAHATREAVAAGYLLEPDAEDAMEWAAQSNVGK
jgi:Alpha/beta hydrolase domain